MQEIRIKYDLRGLNVDGRAAIHAFRDRLECVANVSVKFTSDNPHISVSVADGRGEWIGQQSGNRIRISSRYQWWDENLLANTLAHEWGHWFGFGHQEDDPNGMMYKWLRTQVV